jgi:hypothetical protein
MMLGDIVGDTDGAMLGEIEGMILGDIVGDTDGAMLEEIEEMMLGDQFEESNVFRWSRVRLNLPGSASYDPTLPWVSKVREAKMCGKEEIAADLLTYVDDQRTTGPTAQECWSASRRVGSYLGHLGMQDASRKRRRDQRLVQ